MMAVLTIIWQCYRVIRITLAYNYAVAVGRCIVSRYFDISADMFEVKIILKQNTLFKKTQAPPIGSVCVDFMQLIVNCTL